MTNHDTRPPAAAETAAFPVDTRPPGAPLHPFIPESAGTDSFAPDALSDPCAPSELQSDLDVAVCGPTHRDGWCKYCQALRQLNVSVTNEREACAQLAESLIDLDKNQDWQQGFNMACTILAHTIRARNRAETLEKVLRSFKRLRRSIASSQPVRLQVRITSAGQTDNCSPAGSSPVSSIAPSAR